MRHRARAPFLALLTLAFSVPMLSRAACGETEQDRIVWARERMYPAISRQQLTLVYQWLVNGTKSCRDSGELWYYRALAAQQLGDKADAAYAMEKADPKLKAGGFNPFAAANQPPAPGVRRVREKWAVVVGIAKFQHAGTNMTLQFSDKDASDFQDFLVHEGGFRKDHVQFLENESATTHNIRQAFGKVRQQAQSDDLVVVYFSSHGWPRAQDPTGLSYVLTHDADTRDQAEVYATALQMVELAELGRWVKARDYVLFLDTCFSGAASEGAPGIVPKGAKGIETFTAALQGLQGSGNRVVVAASQADERSWEDPKASNGYFTRFLLEALQKEPTKISLNAVYQYLRDRVPQEVEKNQHAKQHPVMQSFGDGERIVLGIPENSTAARLHEPAIRRDEGRWSPRASAALLPNAPLPRRSAPARFPPETEQTPRGTR